jgi:predicted nuclease of predicted toxin-antitoxin system
MKLLLDECLPRRLKRLLPGHDVSTVPEMGWAGIQNGQLLSLMEPVFEVFLTIDGNLRYQQNLSGRDLALVVLSAVDNTFETLSPLMPDVLAVLPSLVPGQIVKVAAPSAA